MIISIQQTSEEQMIKTLLLLLVITASADYDSKQQLEICLEEIELQYDYLDKDMINECHDN